MIRILVADDHPAARLGLQAWLSAEADIEVVGEAADGAEALALTVALQPDVVLMDAAMPVMDGIAATAAVPAAAPGSVVVMLSIHDDLRIRQRAAAAGASAFLVKHDPADQWLAAVRQAATMAKSSS